MGKILVPKKQGRGINVLTKEVRYKKGNALFQINIFRVPAILQTNNQPRKSKSA